LGFYDLSYFPQAFCSHFYINLHKLFSLDDSHRIMWKKKISNFLEISSKLQLSRSNVFILYLSCFTDLFYRMLACIANDPSSIYKRVQICFGVSCQILRAGGRRSFENSKWNPRDSLNNSNWIATGCKSRDHLTAKFFSPTAQKQWPEWRRSRVARTLLFNHPFTRE